MEGAFSGGSSRRRGASSQLGTGGYVGLAMVDMDEVECGHGRGSYGDDEFGPRAKSGTAAADVRGQGQEQGQGQEHGLQQRQDDDEDVYVLEDEEDEDDAEEHPALPPSALSSTAWSLMKSPVQSTKNPLKKNVIFDLDSSTEDEGHSPGHSPGHQHGSLV